MKKPLIIATVFFILLGLIGLSLQKVDLASMNQENCRIELKNFQLNGYHNNAQTYKLSAQVAKANRNTDYLHIENIKGTINSGNIEISADNSVLSLYTILFQNNILVKIIQKDIRLETAQLNYSFLSNEIQLPRETTVNFKNHRQLLLNKATYHLDDKRFVMQNVSWQGPRLSLSAAAATLHLSPLEISFQKGVTALLKNKNKKTISIKAHEIYMDIDSTDFSLKGDVLVTLNDQKAFAEQGYFNSAQKTLTLIKNSYIIEGKRRLNAGKIKINTTSFEMEAFDSVEAIINLN